MAERIPEIRDFTTLAPGLMQAPDHLCAQLRHAPPVFWAPKERSWVVHRSAELRAVLADRSFRVAELARIVEGVCRGAGKAAPLLTGLLGVFLPFLNPPEHDLALRYLKAVLAADRVSGFAPVIEAIAADLLAQMPPDGRFDAATAYADLLPPLFMAHCLGLPGQEVVRFVQRTAEMGRTFDRG